MKRKKKKRTERMIYGIPLSMWKVWAKCNVEIAGVPAAAILAGRRTKIDLSEFPETDGKLYVLTKSGKIKPVS